MEAMQSLFPACMRRLGGDRTVIGAPASPAGYAGAAAARERDAFAEAISADFGHRSPHETRLLEVFPSLEDSATRVATCAAGCVLSGGRYSGSSQGRAQVRYQPLGVVGIIVPGITRSIWRLDR